MARATSHGSSSLRATSTFRSSPAGSTSFCSAAGTFPRSATTQAITSVASGSGDAR